MSFKRRVKGWWVICLMAGLGAQPLFAAEAGAVSRAVEVAPPKGWTPDTPLFHDEPTMPGREASAVVTKEEGVRASSPTRTARRLETAVGDEQPTSVQRTRARRLAERSAAVKREPESKVASSREAQRRARATAGKGASLKETRVAKGRAPASAQAVRSAKTARPAAATVTRSAKAKRGEATALAPRQPATQRKKAALVRTEQALASNKPLKARQVAATASPGHAAKAKAHPAAVGRAREKARQKTREPALAQRTAKRASPGSEAGGRAASPGVKKG